MTKISTHASCRQKWNTLIFLTQRLVNELGRLMGLTVSIPLKPMGINNPYMDQNEQT